MRVAILTIDLSARISVRVISALFRSEHEIAAIISPCQTEVVGDTDWEALQHVARSSIFANSAAFRKEADQVKAHLREQPFIDHRVQDLRGTKCEEILRSANADLLLLPAAPMLPRNIFRLTRLGTINVHAGVVPWYRGTATIFHALRNGDLEGVGYTLIMVDEGVDTGDVIYKQVVPVRPDDELLTIYDRCERLATQALIRSISTLGSERTIPLTPQLPNVGFTYRGLPTAHQWRELDVLMGSARWQKKVFKS